MIKISRGNFSVDNNSIRSKLDGILLGFDYLIYYF